MTQLDDEYRARHRDILVPLADRLQLRLQEIFQDSGIKRIDRISVRAKSPDRFSKKARKKNKHGADKYQEPLIEIQDQIGARIVTFYESEISVIESIIHNHFRPIEEQRIVPENSWTFGYFGKHYILLTPTDILPDGTEEEEVPECFELQIKTLFQHAWSEANHDLGYKPELGKLTDDEERQLAFTSAQAWGADRQFDMLFQARKEKEDSPNT